jgi:8-oxo-dGTP pyrophosphatase MutT (NUDIX family)
MYMLEELKEKLNVVLREDLPGAHAHSMMMPVARDARLRLPENQAAPVKSAVLVLFYENEDGHLKFPLIQRPEYNGAHSAQVSLPGGKQEPGDTDLVFTALRETQEEIGIDPADVEVVGKLSEIFIWVSNYQVIPIVGITRKRPHFVLDELEVQEIIEADLFDIINPAKRKEGTIVARGKYKIRTPYFDIDNRVVWGATAMMLSELSVVVSKTHLF